MIQQVSRSNLDGARPVEIAGDGGARGYFHEFRLGWRQLSAATIGIAGGYGVNNYLNNVFIPPLMEEFNWPSSQIALIGLAALTSVICQPVAGRITDRIGVRWVAIFGVTFATLIYVLLSMMSGSFIEFFLLSALQIALVGATTGPVVYSRLIAESYGRARGVALAIATASPSFAGAAIVPFLSPFIEREGWRAGYLLAAACAAVTGAIAIALIPSRPSSASSSVGQISTPPPSYREIASHPALQLIVGGIFLCSMTIVMQTTQMGVILRTAGLSAADSSWVITIYALGVIVGRLLCGAALDRFPTHLVAALALGMPAIGLALLATAIPSVAVMSAAVLFLGLALGAEGDVGGYLAMRYFDVSIYSTIVGIVIGTIAVSSALGSVILSLTLARWQSFSPFLLLAGAAALIGSLLIYRLGKVPDSSVRMSV